MTDGQTRVLVLLLVLAALEALVQPAIRNVFAGAFHQINTGLNTASQPKATQQ
jgi:hypothetical protein